MKLEVTVETTEHGTVDADRVREAFPLEWADFLEDEEPSDELLEDFVRETAAEIGSEIFDFAPHWDTDTDTQVRRA